jgi:hypothetical protein
MSKVVAGPHDPGGFDRDAALTLGRAVAGSSAQMKGRALGIYEPSEEPPSKAAKERRERLQPDEAFGVRLLGRTVPAIRTPGGLRAPLAMIAGIVVEVRVLAASPT